MSCNQWVWSPHQNSIVMFCQPYRTMPNFSNQCIPNTISSHVRGRVDKMRVNGIPWSFMWMFSNQPQHRSDSLFATLTMNSDMGTIGSWSELVTHSVWSYVLGCYLLKQWGCGRWSRPRPAWLKPLSTQWGRGMKSLVCCTRGSLPLPLLPLLEAATGVSTMVADYEFLVTVKAQPSCSPVLNFFQREPLGRG